VQSEKSHGKERCPTASRPVHRRRRQWRLNVTGASNVDGEGRLLLLSIKAFDEYVILSSTDGVTDSGFVPRPIKIIDSFDSALGGSTPKSNKPATPSSNCN
jgi:hypothetical protein